MKHITSKGSALLWTLAVMALLACSAVAAQGQEQRFSVNFEGTPISNVLDAFKRFDPDFAYTLPDGVADRNVTVALVDVTIGEALSAVAEQANLRYVRDGNTYVIRERTERATTRAERPMPQYGEPVFTTRPASPQAAAPAAPDGMDERAVGGDDPRADMPIRLLRVQYSNPALIAELFGGYTIYGDETSMMGGARGGVGTTTPRGGIGTDRRGTTGTTRGGIGTDRGIGTTRGTDRGGIGADRGTTRPSTPRY